MALTCECVKRDDGTHRYPWTDAEQGGCRIARQELIEREQRTDEGFHTGLDNKARIERQTTPELDVDRWTSGIDYEDGPFGD